MFTFAAALNSNAHWKFLNIFYSYIKGIVFEQFYLELNNQIKRNYFKNNSITPISSWKMCCWFSYILFSWNFIILNLFIVWQLVPINALYKDIIQCSYCYYQLISLLIYARWTIIQFYGWSILPEHCRYINHIK